MMNSKKSAPFKKLLYVFIIPFICLATLVFTFRSSHAVSVIEQTFPVTIDIAKSYVEEIKADDREKAEVVKSPEVKYTKVKPVKRANTEELAVNRVDLSDKKANFILVRGIKLSKLTDSVPSSSSQALHMSQVFFKGKTDSLVKEVLVQGKPQGTGAKRIDISSNQLSGKKSESKFLLTEDVILKVNGIEMPISTISNLDPKDIQSVNVIKGGKTGVVTVKGYGIASKENNSTTQKKSGQAEIHIETIQK